MERRIAPKMPHLDVADLVNCPAIPGDPRLELNHFSLQFDCPRINQRLPSCSITQFYQAFDRHSRAAIHRPFDSYGGRLYSPPLIRL